MRRAARTRARARRTIDGFSLIEVMISIVFLSLILLGAAGLMNGVAAGTRNSQGNTLATEILQQKIEELRSLPFDNSNLTAGTHTKSDAVLGRTVSWTVVDDVPDELKRVDLKVTWREPKGQRQLGFRLHLANRTPE